MIASKITRPATHHVWTQGPKDALGDVTWSFVDAPDPLMVEVQQQSAVEVKTGTLVQVTMWLAFFQPGATVAAEDEISVPGLGRFGMDGEPWLVRSPRGHNSHWQARLRKAT